MLKRLLLATAASLFFALSARAATVTVAQTTVPDIQWRGTRATLRVYLNASFTDSNGIRHLQGAVGSLSVYRSVACTLDATTHVLTIPAFTLDTTTDAQDNRAATYTAIFYDEAGTRRESFLETFPVPATFGASVTWAQLNIYKNGATITNPPPAYLTREQTVTLISSMGGGGGTGTVTSVSGGTTGLTVTNPTTTPTLGGTLGVANGGTGAGTAAAARANLGLGTAATLDAPAAGNAASAEVVKGSDTRLTDARTPLTHTHLLSQVTNAGTAAALNVPATGNAASTEVVKGSDTRLTDARTPLTHTHAGADIASGTVAPQRLGTGAPDATTCLRGDGTWGACGAGGGTGTVTSVSGGTTGLTVTNPTTTPTLGGTLGVANGGTGQTSYTDGQILIGSTATGGLSKATITPGSGIAVTNGAGSIQIAATGGTGTVTQINTGTGLTGGPITTTGTISLAATGVTAGSYTCANVTVNAQGQATAAANGACGGGSATTVYNQVNVADYNSSGRGDIVATGQGAAGATALVLDSAIDAGTWASGQGVLIKGAGTAPLPLETLATAANLTLANARWVRRVDTAGAGGHNGQTFSIDYSATGSITAGSTTVTLSAGDALTAADVGAQMTIKGAGVNGDDLRAVISTFISSTQATIDRPAKLTASGREVYWGVGKGTAFTVTLPTAQDISTYKDIQMAGAQYDVYVTMKNTGGTEIGHCEPVRYNTSEYAYCGIAMSETVKNGDLLGGTNDRRVKTLEFSIQKARGARSFFLADLRATRDHLTTVSSVAGTTLTLAAGLPAAIPADETQNVLHEDSAALINAIAAAGKNGVVIIPVRHRINTASTIHIANTTGVRIECLTGTPAVGPQDVFNTPRFAGFSWVGLSGANVVYANRVAGLGMRGCSILTGTVGGQADVAIVLAQRPTSLLAVQDAVQTATVATDFIMTRSYLEHLNIWVKGRRRDGIGVLYAPGSPSNVEFNTLRNSVIRASDSQDGDFGVAIASLSINVKANDYQQIVWDNAKWGVWTSTGGGFTMRGGGSTFSGIDFYLDTVGDATVIEGFNSESANQFMVANATTPIFLRGNRIGDYGHFRDPALPLITAQTAHIYLEGNDFEQDASNSIKVLDALNATDLVVNKIYNRDPNARLTTTGNVWPHWVVANLGFQRFVAGAEVWDNLGTSKVDLFIYKDLNADGTAEQTFTTYNFTPASQWTSAGTSIYYNGGNVGIGTNAPTRPLEIVGSGDTGIGVSTTNATAESYVTLLAGGVSVGAFEAYGPSFPNAALQNSIGFTALVNDAGSISFTTQTSGSYFKRFSILNGGDAVITTAGQGLIFKTPDGTACYKLTVTNAGALSTVAVGCP